MDGCQLICEIFSAYFHSCCFWSVLGWACNRRWWSLLVLSSGQTVVAGGKLPVTSLCSGGETFDGERIRFRCSPPVKGC